MASVRHGAIAGALPGPVPPPLRVTTLLVGGTGFLGAHLAPHLEAAGHRVLAVSRRTGFDVTDAAAVTALVTRPDVAFVVHLAGPAFVPDSRRDPAGCFAVHAGGFLNVLEAARARAVPPRILLLATADSYRPDPTRLPFDEETPIEPENPYAAAKLAQEVLAVGWGRTWGVPVVRLRLFNIVGPGQAEPFVASNFARQAARIALGMQDPVVAVGDLRVARDFVDVKDAVSGMRRALEAGVPGEAYNLASGHATTLEELLGATLRAAGVSARAESPESLARPGQALVRCGSPAKLEAATGWRPRAPLEETARDIVAWWRRELSAGRRP
jgi:GDP-4-dehydro-6-deoxy-D-mannose reductase